MSLIKFFYRRNSLKRKILEIKDGIARVMQNFTNEKFSVMYYGAFDVNPRNLVFWICLKSDQEKQRLSKDENLNLKVRKILRDKEYPLDAQEFVHIGFESQETVDRESKGNWFYHFK